MLELCLVERDEFAEFEHVLVEVAQSMHHLSARLLRTFRAFHVVHSLGQLRDLALAMHHAHPTQIHDSLILVHVELHFYIYICFKSRKFNYLPLLYIKIPSFQMLSVTTAYALLD